ncbi:unnamed protein product [Peronospora belbahrii]|uniref:RING-type domain-containing protein n=1 Tax=Peronospora belbahrii TaxID=622444 RepID=A0ABN8D100_9STRA|nr:unnamed protein product [Peronospora belbahrii]
MTNSNDDDKNEGIANACAICLENMEEDLATLVCGHVFHDTCATQALVRRPACPVCRRKASRRIRLYLSIGAREEEHVTKLHRNRGGSLRAELCTSHNRTTQTVSHLPERMREMKDELDRVNEIQRLTSSHSFRLENKLVRLRQQQEQTKQQIEHIQHDLDRANAKLKRSQRIGSLCL